MGKLFKLGLGRSKTGKILDRDTKWFETAKGLLKHIDENPQDAKKNLYVSVNGRAYMPTTIEKEINRN